MMKKLNGPHPIEHICVKCKKNEDQQPKEKKAKIQKYVISYNELNMNELIDTRKFYDKLKKDSIKFNLKIVPNFVNNKWTMQFVFNEKDKVKVDLMYSQLNIN